MNSIPRTYLCQHILVNFLTSGYSVSFDSYNFFRFILYIFNWSTWVQILSFIYSIIYLILFCDRDHKRSKYRLDLNTSKPPCWNQIAWLLIVIASPFKSSFQAAYKVKSPSIKLLESIIRRFRSLSIGENFHFQFNRLIGHRTQMESFEKLCSRYFL